MLPATDIPPASVPLAHAIAGALGEVARRFDRALDSDVAPVAELCAHVERYRGKMLRPILTLAWSAAVDPARTAPFADDALTAAAVCELVHVATLVHDDVLDEADVRRRGRTLNALRGNEEAVMVGDYLIASAYHLCSTIPDPRAALAVARAAQVTCAGELLQLTRREDWSLDEPAYFSIVERKTGALVAVACELGARAGGGDDRPAHAAAGYGRLVGVAFQIQDDLLDLQGSEGQVGKSVGKDLEKGKLTLPLIHHLASASAAERGRSLALIEAGARGHLDDRGHADLARAIGATGSVAYAADRARRLVDEAIDRLGEIGESPACALLERMARAAIDRGS